MKRVYTANNMSADQEIVKGLLEDAGISCMVRNDNLSTLLGELPSTECSPEIWILNDDDYPKAQEIVTGWRNAVVEDLGAWVCRCGETIEGQFSSCWNCGKERSITMPDET